MCHIIKLKNYKSTFLCELSSNLFRFSETMVELRLKKKKYFLVLRVKKGLIICASLVLGRENLSSGFPKKQVSNRSSQLHRLARKLKFHL